MPDFAVADPEEGLNEQGNPNPITPSTLGQRFMSGAATAVTGSFSDLEQYYARQQQNYPIHTGPLGTGDVADGYREPAASPDQINARYPDLKVKEPLPLSVAADMEQARAARVKQAGIIDRYPTGIGHAIVGLGADAVTGLLDPVGDAAFTIPVIGEERYAAWLARAGAGAGLAGRAAVTLGVGGARAEAGQAILSGAKLGLAQTGIGDYDMGAAAHDLAWAPLAGALLHGATSFGGDILGNRFLESQEGKSAAVSADLHDSAFRTATAQMASGSPVDVRPVFDAAKYRTDLMSGAAYSTEADPLAVARTDNAVARAAGAPSQDEIRWQGDAQAAARAPRAPTVDSAQMEEAKRAVEDMRAAGHLTPEDEDMLARLEAEQPAANGEAPASGDGFRTNPMRIADEHDDEVRSIETQAFAGAARAAAGPGATLATPEDVAAAREQLAGARGALADAASPTLLQTIRKAGGIALRDKKGNYTPEGTVIRQILDKNNRGIINNKTGRRADYMREHLAEQGWFADHPGDEGDIQHLYDGIDREARGEPVYHPTSRTREALDAHAQLEREMTEAGISGREPIEQQARALAEYRAKGQVEHDAWHAAAQASKLEVPAGAQPEDIIDAAAEREAVRAEANGTIEESSNRIEGWIDQRIEELDPEFFDEIRNEELEHDPYPEEREAASDAAEGGGGPEAGDVGAAGVLEAGAGAVARGADAGQQLDIPGSEPSARQLAAAREASGAGRSTARVEQSDADVGLFRPPERNEPTLFQRAAQPFYSTLTRAVDALKQERAPATQWRAIIDNLQGVKKDEIDWSGVREWLADKKGSVTKAELLQHLRENEVQVREVTLGSAPSRDDIVPDAQAEAEYGERWNRLVEQISEKRTQIASRNGPVSPADLRREEDRLVAAQDELHDQMVDDTFRRVKATAGVSGPAKFSSYALPGGSNYRELLLTLPERSPELPAGYAVKSFQQGFAVFGPDGDEVAWGPTRGGALANAAPSLARKGNVSPTFRSSHFDEPNILAHIRFDDRTGPNGERILHIAEVQSDWHQKGRRSGYALPEARRAELDARRAHLEKIGGDLRGEGKEIPDEIKREWTEVMNELQPHNAGKVPDAPFKTTWQELAAKRMLRYAAEHGYDKLSWDTGDTNADRYDLSKQLSRVDWTPNATDVENDHEGTLTAFDKRGAKVFTKGIKASEISDHIGKDVAEKLLTGENLERMKAGIDAKVEGLNLRVGGEGMRGFYDKILPAFLNKYAKKWGAKVEHAAMEVQGGERGAIKHTTGAHQIDITPAMRESVMAGQPLFERRAGTGGGGERVALNDDLIASLPDNPSPAEREILDRVRAITDQIAPQAKVVAARSLEISEGLKQRMGEVGDFKVSGATYENGQRRIIAWALNALDPEGTARHEVMHWLKHSGFFTEPEWSAFESAAKAGDWMGKYDISARYPDLAPEGQMEEAIAEEMGNWGRDVPNGAPIPDFIPEALRPAYQRFRQLLAQIGDYLRRAFGANVTANDVFSRIMSGEIGARQPFEGERYGTTAFQLTPEQAAREEQMDAAVAARKKLTAYQDLQKRQALIQAVQNFHDQTVNRPTLRHPLAGIDRQLPLAQSIDALTRGISEPVKGARESTASEQLARANDFMGGFQSALDKIPGGMAAWRTRSLTAEWVRELAELNSEHGKPGVSKSPMALEIARAVNQAQGIAKMQLNQSGAWIGDYDGYVSRTAHNAVKIDRAGYEAWREFTLERLDQDRTFANIDTGHDAQAFSRDTIDNARAQEIERFMHGVWDGLSTGVHMSSQEGVGRASNKAGAFSGPGSMGKRLSSERVLHWKDADAWREYQEKFGDQVIERGVINTLHRAAHDSALMRRWGSNPQYTFDNLLRTVKEQYRDDHAALREFQASEPRLREEFAYLSGASNMTGQTLRWKIRSGVLAWQDITKLGNVLFAHFSTFATKPFQLMYHGVGPWQAYTSTIRNFVQENSPEARQTLENLRSNATGLTQNILTGYEPIDGVPGRISSLRMKMMRLGGLPWALGLQKAGTEWEISNFLGQRLDMEFSGLNPATQRALKIYGIDEAEWNVLRSAPDHDTDGQGSRYLTPQAAQRAPDAMIDHLAADRMMAAPSLDENVRQRIRDETRDRLMMKLAAYYADSADRSTVTPGVPERALFSGVAGRFGGSIIGQYKTWATAAVRQIWGQALYGSSRGEALKAIAGVIAVGTAAGYVRTVVTDLLSGKQPRMFNGDLANDAEILIGSMVKGSGLGILGDMILGQFEANAGSGKERALKYIAQLAGPVIGDLASLGGVGFDYLTAGLQKHPAKALQSANANALHEVQQHLPIVNLFYVRTVMNWLVWNRLYEMANPGYLRRYQARIKQMSHGQTYWSLGGVAPGEPTKYAGHTSAPVAQ